jgi:hypothetical protein
VGYEGVLRLVDAHAVDVEPLTEADGITRIDFGCHPSEPLKVLDDWHEPVHCLICGQLLMFHTTGSRRRCP